MTEVKKSKHIKTQRNRLTKYNLTKKKESNLSKSNNDPKIKKNKQRNKQKEKDNIILKIIFFIDLNIKILQSTELAKSRKGQKQIHVYIKPIQNCKH